MVRQPTCPKAGRAVLTRSRCTSAFNCGVVVEQGGHYAVGEGNLSVVEHHDADVLDGYRCLLLWLVIVLFQFDHQLPVA